MVSADRLCRPCSRRLLSTPVIFVLGSFTLPLHAQQSLDEAVDAQLAYVFDDVLFIDSCQLAVGRDPNVVLDVELRAICTRGQPDGGPTTSSGGNSSTPAAMPEAVRRRLDADDAPGTEGPVRGWFLTLSMGPSDREVSEFEDGYQGDVTSLLAGLDRQFGDWVAGFAVEQSTQEGDFVAGGDFENTSLGFTGFGSRALSDKAVFDLYAGYASLNTDRLRVANFTHFRDDGSVFRTYDGLPTADFDAKQTLAGAQFSYTVSTGNVTFGPRVGLDWSTTDFDPYTEVEAVDSGLALNFFDDKRTSLISTIGVDGSVAISTNFGVVVVSEYLYWKHEHDDEQRSVNVRFVQDIQDPVVFQFQTEPPDEEFLEFGANVIFLFQRGLQVFFAYDQLASHRFLDTQVFSAGIRKEF